MAVGMFSTEAAAHGNCEQVSGTFSAQSLPPELCDSPVELCTVGMLDGGLEGSYEFTGSTQQAIPNTPLVYFTGISDIVLDEGAELTAMDRGLIDFSQPGIGKLRSVLFIVDGGHGALQIQGTLNLQNGQITGTYSGLVCTH